MPPQIDKAIPLLSEQLAEFNMQLLEATPISYGRKVKVACDKLWAELNVFYGKKGFTVVRTTKTGSNAELATLAAQIFEQILSMVGNGK